MSRKNPSSHIGSVLRSILATFGFSGEERWSGDLIIGIAETIPCENTNDPTPRSIYGLPNG